MVAKVLKKVADLIEEDHSHRVIIKKTYTAGRFLDPIPPDYKCKDFSIRNGKFRVYKTGKRTPIVDGASCAPDKIGSIDIANAYIVHDLMYYHLEDIAEKWDWDPDKVRELADACLGNAIAHEGGFLANVISRVYYSAVRVFGGFYHGVRKLFVITVLVLGMAAITGGCFGCAAPLVFEVDQDADYEVINAPEGD